MSPHSTLRDFGRAVLSGLLLAASFLPLDLWPLAWVALVPLWLAIARSPSVGRAVNLGAVAGLVFYGLALSWYWAIFGLAAVSFWCIFAFWLALHGALVWKVFHWTDAAGESFWRGVLASAGLALSWVGIEYFRAEKWPLANTWMCLGYSQGSCPPFLQTASLVGVYGMSGLVAFVNACWCRAWLGQRKLAWAALGTLLLCLAWGGWRLGNLDPDEGSAIKVALIQQEDRVLDRLAALSRGQGAGKADLVVWPEYCFQVLPGREQRSLDLLGRELKGHRALFVVGAYEEPLASGPPAGKNYAWVFKPSGAFQARYEKLHPIPFLEKYLRPNPDPRMVESPLGALGVQICYDFDFENGSRLLAGQGAEILVVPNMDSREWGRWQHLQHSAMAPFRSVEEGLWTVRAASSGISQVIDPLGRVRRSLEFGKEGPLLGLARLGRHLTFYGWLGWLLAPACMWLTGLALAVLLWRHFWNRPV
jgi:apolipoprotein N-acyltransferase